MELELNTLKLADIVAKTGKSILILCLDKEEKSMTWMSSNDITEAMIPMIEYVTVDMLQECKNKPTNAKVNDLIIRTIKSRSEIYCMLSLFHQNMTQRLDMIMIDRLNNLSYFGVTNRNPYTLAIADLLARISLSIVHPKPAYIRWGEKKIRYITPGEMRQIIREDRNKFQDIELLRRSIAFPVADKVKPLHESEIKLVVEVAGKLIPSVRDHLATVKLFHYSGISLPELSNCTRNYVSKNNSPQHRMSYRRIVCSTLVISSTVILDLMRVRLIN